MYGSHFRNRVVDAPSHLDNSDAVLAFQLVKLGSYITAVICLLIALIVPGLASECCRSHFVATEEWVWVGFSVLVVWYYCKYGERPDVSEYLPLPKEKPVVKEDEPPERPAHVVSDAGGVQATSSSDSRRNKMQRQKTAEALRRHDQPPVVAPPHLHQAPEDETEPHQKKGFFSGLWPKKEHKQKPIKYMMPQFNHAAAFRPSYEAPEEEAAAEEPGSPLGSAASLSPLLQEEAQAPEQPSVPAQPADPPAVPHTTPELCGAAGIVAMVLLPPFFFINAGAGPSCECLAEDRSLPLAATLNVVCAWLCSYVLLHWLRRGLRYRCPERFRSRQVATLLSPAWIFVTGVSAGCISLVLSSVFVASTHAGHKVLTACSLFTCGWFGFLIWATALYFLSAPRRVATKEEWGCQGFLLIAIGVLGLFDYFVDEFSAFALHKD